MLFLSTPSVGRATYQVKDSKASRCDFYPRPPWGGRPPRHRQSGTNTRFLSTPSVGRATNLSIDQRLAVIFLSTPSVGRATARQRHSTAMFRISIHALRGEGDGMGGKHLTENDNFYPRPPWGGRPVCFAACLVGIVISIHALRGEGDGVGFVGLQHGKISIHALRGEGDIPARAKSRLIFYFYPRPPWGGRLPKPAIPSAFLLISIHALRGEGDSSTDPATPPSRISIHALRGEGDGLSVTGLDWVN